ncbi:MAG: hypothetical protein A2W77_09115 [Nitrospinae bacterium RIFCSPLOWO2_12_39_16]|nr:MAG: hypothetical protein A2328_06070 [Bdellovibrionales bacterium RIFOXYB2_FULL_36_6]OGW09637.1 MAG: hypothetical protein A2W77_09115 [Nitrospinae bacterium RIFCSPLOWO2_12_39_16]HBA26741.1 DUF507 domain-containing protein [Nitrospinota bacterium]
MRLGRDKINHLSKLIITELAGDDRVEFFDEENKIRLEIVRVVTDVLKVDDEIDEAARKTLASYSKNIREGTPEWEVLYNKHYNEEAKKRRGF